MPDSLTIADLIRNRTLSAEIAATLWAAVEERRSFVVAAIPRFAGKTTLTNAVLGLLSPEVPIHRLSGDEAEITRFKERATGGYLAVAECSQAPVPAYIWGAPVRRVFDTLTMGYSLAAALHAPGLQETFDSICTGNGVADDAASRIDFVLYIRRFGDDLETFLRRLAEVHEVDYVQEGRPHGRLLYHWVEEGPVRGGGASCVSPGYLRGAGRPGRRPGLPGQLGEHLRRRGDQAGGRSWQEKLILALPSPE